VCVCGAVDTEVWLGGLEGRRKGGGFISGRCSMVDFDRDLRSFLFV